MVESTGRNQINGVTQMAKKRRKTESKYIARRIFMVLLAIALAACIFILVTRLAGPKEEGEESMPESSLPESSQSGESSSEEPTLSKTEPSEPEDDGTSEGESEADENSVGESSGVVPASDPVAVEYDDSWLLILASASNPLPSGYAPPQLETISGEYQVDSRIAPDLRRMIADAKLEGITLMVCSAYRAEDYQAYLHNRQIDYYKSIGQSDEEAVATASSIVLPPGTSEHQTGLTCDIVTPAYQELNDGFAETAAAKWMAEHSWKYGFVLRYPKDKQDITKIIFEPWHFRYVGLEHAKAMKEGGYCLEEYLYIVQKQNVDALSGSLGNAEEKEESQN